MADHELEVEALVGVPGLAGVKARYKRAWAERSRTVLEEAASVRGVTATEFEHLLEEHEATRDALWRAMNRAVEVSDPDYLSALGRLVAATLDDARVDLSEYITGQILKLEPLQLRVLWLAHAFIAPEEGASDEGPWRRVSKPSEASIVLPLAIQERDVASEVPSVPELAQEILDGLKSLNLLGTGKGEGEQRGRIWVPTKWGIRTVLHVFPNLRVSPSSLDHYGL